jgi:ATP-dependent DNA helicase RecQ
VFSDKSLQEMAKYLPITQEDFLEINGVGEKKLEKYGLQFLELIKKIKGEESPTKIIITPKKETKSKKASTKDSSHRISYELFLEGKDIEEIAIIRKSKFDTILNHLFKCHDEGLEVDFSRLVNEDKEKLILDAVSKVGKDKLKPIKDILPNNIEYWEIKVVVKLK